jgi:CSLREA domain-containing protein
MMRLTHNRVAGIRVLALLTLLAALMAAFVMLAASQAHASSTFTVNSTEDHADANLGLDGCDTGYDLPGTSVPECTLRAALNEANYTSGADTINFAILGTGVHTIAPESSLPQITEPVSINGYTQPGATPNTLAKGTNAKLLIELKGSKLSTPYHGLAIGASNSTIKGLVINSFGNSGINITDNPSPTPVGNRIEGNFIGTDPSGTQDLGNGDDGITIDDSSSNTVGGTSLASRNLISGNTDGGVYISSGNHVRGNLIGTKKDGITPLGNGTNGGVMIDGMSSIVAGNTIASNLGAGVAVVGVNGNRILSNSIFANGLLGIDLGDDGPTANDAGDADTGANNLQNKPLLSSAKKSATGTTTVRGTLNSTPGKTFNIQFFSNPQGGSQGKTLLGSKSVTTNGSGNVSFSLSTKKRVRLGQNITATATGAGGTSEFSAPRKVVSA